MDTLPAVPPTSPRVRLALYGAVALVAVALWLLGPSLLPAEEAQQPVGAAPAVDVRALDAVDRDLSAWSRLLADPRLEQLQPASQLLPARPGNPSPFNQQSAPAQ